MLQKDKETHGSFAGLQQIYICLLWVFIDYDCDDEQNSEGQYSTGVLDQI